MDRMSDRYLELLLGLVEARALKQVHVFQSAQKGMIVILGLSSVKQKGENA